MIDLDELEELARSIPDQSWCLHPNGYSVWTGTEYSSDPSQLMVCRSGVMTDEESLRRMEFVAALSPGVILELIRLARGNKTP